MTPQHRFIDRDDLIKFLKFAGFDIELTERTDTVEELAISGFDDTGDVYYFELSRPVTSPTSYDHDVIGDILRSHSSPASIVQYESWISGMKYTDIKAAGTVAAIWIGDMRYLLDEEAERKRNKSLRTGGEP